MGLRIKISNSWHYGWIRFTVFSNSSGFIIKDYAYESTPNLGIIAGNTTSSIYNTLTTNTNVNIFFSDKTLYINNPDYQPLNINIINCTGQKVLNFKSYEQFKSYNLSSLIKGIYLISVSSYSFHKNLKIEI